MSWAERKRESGPRIEATRALRKKAERVAVKALPREGPERWSVRARGQGRARGKGRGPRPRPWLEAKAAPEAKAVARVLAARQDAEGEEDEEEHHEERRCEREEVWCDQGAAEEGAEQKGEAVREEKGCVVRGDRRGGHEEALTQLGLLLQDEGAQHRRQGD